MSAQDASRSPPIAAHWPLPASTTLGSSVRAKRIEREIRARIPAVARKYVVVEPGVIRLRMSEGQHGEFTAVSAKIDAVLERVDTLPVLPREAEDILSISSRERHKWLKDGRLKSIGTRTVKMRGRTKKVTFHVFDPRHVEDVLDRDLPALWREEDAEEAAENRRRGAGRAAATRKERGDGTSDRQGARRSSESATLEGWVHSTKKVCCAGRSEAAGRFLKKAWVTRIFIGTTAGHGICSQNEDPP